MLLSDLQPASFRGAQFLVPRDTAQEGRNTIEHAYPDASFRYMEDNGRIPPKFELTAVLHGPNLGGKYRALRSALTRPGPGTLRHPWYGRQFVVVDGTFRVKRDDKTAGVLELSIPFCVTGPPILPGIVSGVSAVVSGLTSSAITRMWEDFVADYVSPTSAKSLEAMAGHIGTIAGVLKTHFADATSTYATIEAQSANLARDPARFAAMIVPAFRAPFELDHISAPALVSAYCDICVKIRTIGSEADALPVTTADYVARKVATATLVDHAQGAAFAALAEAMAGRVYGRAEEVEADEIVLTDTFEALQERGLRAARHAELADIYVQTSELLKQAAVRLPRITTISDRTLPASILSYQLYDTDAKTEQLVELNLPQTPILMTGDLSALTVAAGSDNG